MLPEIEQLLVIQDRDQRIRRLKTELKNAPLERQSLETKRAAARAGADGARQMQRDLEVKRAGFQSEAATRRDKIAKLKTQQMQTRKNEEFQALANEIAYSEKEVARIEDSELEIMGQLEEVAVLVASAEANAKSEEGKVATQIADLDSRIESFKGQLAEVEAERSTLAKEVDEDRLNLYERLFTTKGGNAVVPFEGEVCTGCHMRLTTQTAVRVRGEQVITHCEQCGRILYLPR